MPDRPLYYDGETITYKQGMSPIGWVHILICNYLSLCPSSIQEAIRADEQRAKMKLQDRKELEAEEERQKLIDEQRMLASAGEQNAASTVRLRLIFCGKW